ncbi:MlaD family protein [Candidatus Fukatsuia symbiotica]|uniref:Paraquat-inducible protein B n=1 Tax=Candidatus Fukatsuia symbiotica TaxID=1878942 RepID=A0A2U8I7C7_9GAMM|nr:MlaD family protein [Candidatus Fukatsuia symbiotica]AWK13824.1 Paraquat-inducible protein B [Candidatus Fukatsuia symbiotica]MEA9446025.1 MlaD family protein [Candidatus Fukatsuia symbiotica]
MQQETPNTPIKAQIKHKSRISPFWLLPFIALLIAGGLVYNNWQQRGTEVTIDFQSAAGIVAGRTPIRYQGVDVGVVQSVNLNQNLSNIEVKANIKNDLKNALRSGTQFWLVTPKASLAGVSGLDALVGGNYIGIMPGSGKLQTHFTALDTQPKFHQNTGELMVHLYADDLGSLNTGSLVYYRKIPVGKVYDYNIAPQPHYQQGNDQKHGGVIIDVLIDRRFAKLVKSESRFWNVSGFKGTLSLNGLSVQMENMSALVNGAIAFDSPPHSSNAGMDQQFQLYDDLAQSQRGVSITLDLPNANNLNEGRTPLIYQGLQVGTLTTVTLQADNKITGELTIDPSVVDLMRSGSRIEMRSPRISFNEIKLSEILTGNTLELFPGGGELQKHFTVLDSISSLLQQPNVLQLQLNAPQSYGIDVGQPITLNGIKIGQILSRRLNNKGVMFTAAIEAAYRHLVHQDSKFAVNSRISVKLGFNGIDIEGASAQEWIDGGILLLPGSNSGKPLKQYLLYGSVSKAQQGLFGATPITLTLVANSLPDVQTGSVVLYRKFQVGEIVNIRPKAEQFEVDVYIQPQYRNLLTDNSIFWTEGGAKIQLDTSGLNIQASPLNRVLKGAISFDNLAGITTNKSAKPLLYISESVARARAVNQATEGLIIVLDTVEAGSLQVGTPLLFRGIEVGTVRALNLGGMSDRVQITLCISPKYQHLVRQNSVFWLASGYNLEFGLTGGVLKSGTFGQFIRGGIAFATPPTVPLAPKAQVNQHFLLNTEAPKGWKNWGTAIPTL